MHVTITVESIHNANAQFWEQMLAMQLEPISETQLRCIGAEHVMGGCNLSGVWVGSVEVRLSRGLALQATSAMLMQPVEQVQASDTLDAIKEIANMIAGTIKSALPRPCVMTVPFAEVAAEDFCILPRTQDSVTVFFRHATGELMVRVWEQPVEPKSETNELAELCA
jgi:CheY-specific phosphatase CheX